MTKTIEEAAKEYSADANVTSENFCAEDITDAFENGANYIMSLPLASRLTAEEKERVRKEYGELLCYASIHKRKLANSTDAGHTRFNSQNYQFYVAQIKLLERIFGSDFLRRGMYGNDK